jgi:hypothetical protein
MKKGLSILLVVLICFGPTVGFADSFIIEHDRYPDESERINNKMCSFPVTVNISSNINDALFFDDTGTLVRILSTVNHATITFSANGKSLTAIGSGGIEYLFNPDGTVTVHTFGINLLMTIPHYGPVFLDVGRATFVFEDTHLYTEFIAGPASYDIPAFCNALS